MKLYQLVYLPNEWYAAAFGGLAGLIAGTVVDWSPLSASLGWESALVGILTVFVYGVALVSYNLSARLRADGWPADS